MQAVILCRVSSQEQEQGHSLAAQLARLTEYATRRQMTILKEFVITESSVRGNRAKFNECLKFCKSQREPIALIADSVDRVQRTFSEIGLLNDVRLSGKLELHFYRENLVVGKDSNSQDIMRWEFAVLAAHSYVLSLSENIRRSINHKIRNGEINSHAPIGYMNVRDATGRPDIIPDPERAPYIKKIFEIYSQGNVSLRDLSNMAYEWGLTMRGAAARKIPKRQIHHIIQNRFYYGEIDRNGTIYQLRYQPIISKELWELCDRVRRGYGKKPFKNKDGTCSYATLPFLYRGLIKCANSGRICTTERHKGKYIYVAAYREDGTRDYVPEEHITEQIARVLNTIKPPKEFIKGAREVLKNEKAAETEWRTNEIRRLNNELEAIKTRGDNLLNLYIDGKVDDTTYAEKNEQIKRDRLTAENAIRNHSAADDKFNETIINLLSVSDNAGDIFLKSSDVARRVALLKLVFRTLELKDGNLGYSLNFPFDKMQECTQKEKWWSQSDSN